MPPPPTVVPSTELEKLLRDWSALNAHLRTVSSARELLPLLRYAVEEEARGQVLERVYGRFSRLRASEERMALKEGRVPATIVAIPT